MKVILKYFILFLFLYACKGNREYANTENTSLYSEPLSVTLDISVGYVVNKITGDSIKPLINSLGDTVKTGISLLLKAAVADAEKLTKPNVSKVIIQQKEIIAGNIYQVLKKPGIISGDTIEITNNNEILGAGTLVNVVGEKSLLLEPKPVKALPLRFKDEATSNIQYLEISQGLSYSFVHSILIDKKGYLWFGLYENGLCKYDGISITKYTQKEGLPDNNVTSLLEDSSGNIWIGTNNGLCVVDGKNITVYSKKNGFPGNLITKLHKDKRENIWIDIDEINTIRYDGKNFIQYAGSKKLSQEIINPLFEDSHNSMWYITKSGLGKFDGNKFVNYTVRKNENDTTGYLMIEDRKGDLWIASLFGGFFKYNGKDFFQYDIEKRMPGNLITSLIEDKRGNIWTGTRYTGINKFDGNGFKVYNIKDGLTNNAITQLAEDKDGNIWSSTEGGGVNKLNDESFKQIVTMENLGNSRVRPMMKDAQGNLWFGNEAGNIYKYDARPNESLGQQKNIVCYTNSNMLPRQGLRSILADKRGNLWFGYTDDGGLYKYDGKMFLHYTAASGIRGESIMFILEDSKGIIWLGTKGGGINRFDGNKFSYYSEKEKFSSKNIFAMLEDKKGNLWFGTDGSGVVKYDGKNFITFSEKEGFFGRTVTSIVEDETGNLWFATLGAGVCKFDGNTFTYFTEKQGLSFNDVWSLKEDGAGQFWAGTDKGLSLLIPQKNSLQPSKNNYNIYSFGLEDGLKGTDFNLHSVCIDNNNHIWWGTGKALITWDLNTPYVATSPNSLSLNYIEVNEKFYDFRSLKDSSNKEIYFSDVMPFKNYPVNLVLPYNQNHLSFHFSAIDWIAPDKIKYSCRLVGLDDKWSNPSAEPQVDYRNLGYGSYEFQVKAIGQSHVWTAPFTYKFSILPAWWQTWWFRTLIILAALVLVFFVARFIYYYQLRKEKVALEKQLAVQYERQRISTEMHDDIGAGLSGVRLLTEMTKSKLKDTEATSEMDKIYQSIGDISSKMKEVIWSLNTENDDMASLISFIQKQARGLLQNYPGDFTMEISEKIPEIDISGEARRNIYLAVKEALHNIIKHSGAGKINLTISCNEKLIITVSDNGKGFKINTQGNSGNGLKNMRQRMQALGGNLILKSHDGTSVIFEIPLKPAI